MTTAEKILFEKAYSLARYWDRERDLQPNEQLILEQAFKILLLRWWDMFNTMIDFLMPDPKDRAELYISFLQISHKAKKWYER